MEGARDRQRDLGGAERWIFRSDLKPEGRVDRSVDVDRLILDWRKNRSGALNGE